MAVENEYKYTCDATEDAERMVSELESFLISNGVPFKKKQKRSVDYYYDSAGCSLYEADCSLRRKVTSKGSVKLTAKRPISSGGGVLSREEIERSSDGGMEDLMDFANQQFPDLDLSLVPSLVAECERTAFDYKDRSELKLSFDEVEYVHLPFRHRFYEIELESMGASECRDFDSFGLIPFITDRLGFRPSSGSKYRRGIDWKRSLERSRAG